MGIQALRQRDDEEEMEFGHHLMLKFSRRGVVYSQEEQVNKYLEGLTTAISVAVGRHRKMFPERFMALTEVIELVESYGRTKRSRKSTRRMRVDEKYPSRIRLKRVLDEPSVHLAESN